ncbi:unnamed protein product [Rotaria magnacalcarata]|uniref:Uncharacterized protein n=1 Tax=Rotaria magnacalcarata TaxID=392030 RepID=A0A816NKL2_9BILA|nr:unnamed protein product [Rotaria magnacalcarata]CAF2072963.1 unnamed protein product [Rotaria magnacalcarata]CAF4246332.1 unnamed protein product [Rotaria magnacalcarata]CAF4353035.1 unnamed protein product [Rotaria magnacalcarata]
MSSQHNIHAAQMNSNNLKRHLLGWIIGLSFCTNFLLFLIVILILFAPTLLRRYTTWDSKRKLTLRARFITKFNLVECSALPSVQPSYDDLLKQLSEQKQQLENLTRELSAPNTSLLTSSKIF